MKCGVERNVRVVIRVRPGKSEEDNCCTVSRNTVQIAGERGEKRLTFDKVNLGFVQLLPCVECTANLHWQVKSTNSAKFCLGCTVQCKHKHHHAINHRRMDHSRFKCATSGD